LRRAIGERGALALWAGGIVACSSAGAKAVSEVPQDAGGSEAGDASAPVIFAQIGQPMLLGNQFYFTEGPVWSPSDGVLYFSDINAPSPDGGAGGAIYRLTLPNTFDLFFGPTGNGDGLGLDPQGNIIVAGYASRNVWRLSPSKTQQILVPCAGDGGSVSPADQDAGDQDGGVQPGASCYDGMELNTPDDITSRSDGTLYFTDPTFGSGSQGLPVAASLPLSGAQGVYRLAPDGTLHLEDSTTNGPNGVNLSPDEATLYVAYTLTGEVVKFDVAPDGSLSNKTTFATGATIADSMCVDSAGDVYVGTLHGLDVFAPAGHLLGTISVDGLIVTNCGFGGADQRTLFITARTQATLSGAPPMGGGSLYAIQDMPVSGIPGQN
jgi:gluconolactonase